jgi:hypothetical protein
MLMQTSNKAAFVELCRYFLGLSHNQGRVSGFNPTPDDIIVALDFVVNFPDVYIEEYIRDQRAASAIWLAKTDQVVPIKSLRELAHGVVNEFYDRHHSLTEKEHGSILSFIQVWKKQFKP